MGEPVPLQQFNRTYVRQQGRVLSFFGGCDYFRFSTHPKILAAIHTGLDRYGLNVASSRRTTGNHELYLELEAALAEFFGAQAALAVSTGYSSSIVAAQALAGEFSHVLLDERSHVALRAAAGVLNCPVLKFKHRDAGELAVALKRCGPGARPILLTDGMFSHDGSVAPLRAYLKVLPRDGLMLVDDAHGVGTLGSNGRGSLELEGVSHARVVQCVTLSKAFGVYGGAVLGSVRMRERIATHSPQFIGSTPLPLPLVSGAIAAVKIMARSNAGRKRLQSNTGRVRTALRAAGWDLPETPGPILPLPPMSAARTNRLTRALMAAGIFPSLLKYPGGPAEGYFRFVISSEHTRQQLDALIRVVSAFAG